MRVTFPSCDIKLRRKEYEELMKFLEHLSPPKDDDPPMPEIPFAEGGSEKLSDSKAASLSARKNLLACEIILSYSSWMLIKDAEEDQQQNIMDKKPLPTFLEGKDVERLNLFFGITSEKDTQEVKKTH